MSGKSNAINTNIPVSVSNGGTGLSSYGNQQLLCGGTTTTGALQKVATLSTEGHVLLSNGASALPSFASSGLLGVTVQIIQATLNASSIISSPSTWTDSGLSVAITPTFTTSTILILSNIFIGGPDIQIASRLRRNSTTVGASTSTSVINATNASTSDFIGTSGAGYGSIMYLDSPSTTSSITYTVQLFPCDVTGSIGSTIYINSGGSTEDVGATSNIIAIEVLA